MEPEDMDGEEEDPEMGAEDMDDGEEEVNDDNDGQLDFEQMDLRICGDLSKYSN